MIADLKPYTEYKDSGLPWLGQVPGHWEIKRGKSYLTAIDERSKTGKEELLTVSAARGIVPRRTANVTMFKAESYAGHKLCWPDDLVVNSLWAWAGGLGVSEHHGIISTAYSVYRARRSAGINPRFLHQLVRSSAYQWELQVRSKGVWISRLQLTDTAFLDSPIPLPPSDEQAAIVRFLGWANGRLERAIRAKRKVIALLNEQKQAIIHCAVTRGLDSSVPLKASGIPWLGDIPSHWEVRRLRTSISDCVNGLWGTDPDGKSDITCVRVADFDRNNLRVTLMRKTTRAIPEGARGKRMLKPGDLLLEKSGGGDKQPVGAVVIYEEKEPAVCSNFVARMPIADGHHSGFINYLHCALYARRINVPSIKQTTGIQNLDWKSYLSEMVAFPPAAEQRAISEFLDFERERFADTICRLEREIDLLREYRTRLVADVVTGKLDVREEATRLPDDELLLDLAAADDEPDDLSIEEETDA